MRTRVVFPARAAVSVTAALMTFVCTPAAFAGSTPGPSPSTGVASAAGGANTLLALQQQAVSAELSMLSAKAALQRVEVRVRRAEALAAADTAAAARATRQAQAAHAALQQFAAAVYMDGGDAMTVASAISAANQDPRILFSQLTYLRVVGHVDGSTLVATAAAEATARRLARAAAAARRAAEQQAAGLRARLAALGARTSAAESSLDQQLRQIDAQLAAQTAAQQADDQAAAARWQAYLDALVTGGVVPPPAAALADPGHLPPGLAPVRSTGGALEPGVAKARAADGRWLTVLPAETVRAVDAAFAAIGKPYLTGASGPDAFDCGGLAAAAFGAAHLALPTQPNAVWSHSTAVPDRDLKPGDLVFPAAVGDQVSDVGVYVGDGFMIHASHATWSVHVERVPAGPGSLAGAVRPSVPARHPRPLPPATAAVAGPQMTCGGYDYPAGGPQAAAWGGYVNGMIPLSAMCQVAGGFSLRCDAAASFTRMSAAYAQQFGTGICITQTYRTFAEQVSLYAGRKRGFAATPGRSNHGWGLAADLCGGVERFGSIQHDWMLVNGPRFGWFHPSWAEPGASAPEPWHFEFGHIS